jgi:hypothetical protein
MRDVFKIGLIAVLVLIGLAVFFIEQNGSCDVCKPQKLPIDVSKYSLPVLAIILGLIDGFNPCAMWVLVFLIGLILGLKEKKKLWILVGSFVFASGVLYFLFMTAWLNVFFLIGYVRPVLLAVGLFGIYVGISNLREFAKGEITCPLPSKRKLKLASELEKLVLSPLTWLTLGGIVILAFVVNAVEFACSSFIPVIFTQTLALHNLHSWAYYAYILLYDLFFMLDDLIIFSLAAFAALQAGPKYEKWARLIGGIVLLILGIMLVFTPHLLR